jgi:hypothetical protein
MGVTYTGEFVHVLMHGNHSDVQDCNFYVEVAAMYCKY